ncbi:hypothetical protein QE414_000156 [Microbacterium sp. SORGH_AS 344]|nr:hypothetical protein [Microbacterium sp. SORGH_AS_0344]
MDLGADDDVELFGEREGCLDDLGPDRVRDEIARDDPDLGSHETEAQALGQAQVALQGRRALLDRHVTAVRAAGVQARVDPRAHVGGLEPVLLEQGEPLLDPRVGGVRVVRHVRFAEDLQARRPQVGDRGHGGLEVHDRAEIAHVAVERDAVSERGAGCLGRERDVLGDPVGARLVLLRDVRHPQPQLDRQLVHPVGQTTGKRHGDDRGVLERPAHAVAVPQLGERVGPALQGPQRHVGRDVDQTRDADADAVDQRGRHAAVRRHPDAELEAGDLTALADVAEADGLDEVSFEKHRRSLSLWFASTLPRFGLFQT